MIAIAGKLKSEQVSTLGPKAVIDRAAADQVSEVLSATGGERISMVADVVGGDRFAEYLSLLRRGGDAT